MKNHVYPIFILFTFITFFAGCVGNSNKEIAQPYEMKSGKMVNRFETAILNMEREDSTRVPQEDEILFIGSSSIRLWNTLVVDMLPMNAINRGFGGSTISEVIYYADRIVIPYKPKLIVFYCGENDIDDGYSPQEVFELFKQFDELVHRKMRKTQILFISLKPSLDRWDLWDKLVETNRLIKEYSESKDHLHYWDSSKSMLTPEGTPDSTIFLEDGLHINKAGYARWNAELKPIIESIMGVSATAPSN